MHCMFNSQSSGSQTLSSSSFSSSPGAKSSNKRWIHRCSWIEISVQFYHQLQFFSIQLTHTGGSLLALLASNFISLKLACTVHRCKWYLEQIHLRLTFSFYLSSFVLAPVGKKNQEANTQVQVLSRHLHNCTTATSLQPLIFSSSYHTTCFPLVNSHLRAG